MPVLSLRRCTAIFFAPTHASRKFDAFQTLWQSTFFKSFEAAAQIGKDSRHARRYILSSCQSYCWSPLLTLHRKKIQCANAMFPTHECHSFLEPGLPHSEGRVTAHSKQFSARNGVGPHSAEHPKLQINREGLGGCLRNASLFLLSSVRTPGYVCDGTVSDQVWQL